MSRNNDEIWTRVPLQYFLITVEVIALEKFAFSDIQNPKTAF